MFSKCFCYCVCVDDLDPVPGQAMAVRSVEEGVVAWRRRMCYTCDSCRVFEFPKCKRAGCGAWREHKLEAD